MVILSLLVLMLKHIFKHASTILEMSNSSSSDRPLLDFMYSEIMFGTCGSPKNDTMFWRLIDKKILIDLLPY